MPEGLTFGKVVGTQPIVFSRAGTPRFLRELPHSPVWVPPLSEANLQS